MMAPMPEALVVDEIETRVRKQLLQFDRPFVEGKRLQKAGRRIVVECRDGYAGNALMSALGGMEDHASTVEHDALFGHPQRSLGEKVAQQLLVILPDRLRQHAFHVMADRDGQSEALRIEGACRARYVDHAKQFAIGRDREPARQRRSIVAPPCRNAQCRESGQVSIPLSRRRSRWCRYRLRSSVLHVPDGLCGRRR